MVSKIDMLLSIDTTRKKENVTRFILLDIPLRLEELSNLENGWLNGEGIAIKKEHLNWFADIFESNYNPSLPRPYLYPSISGGIQAEWSLADWDISLNIDLNEKNGFYQSLKHGNEEVVEASFDLTKVDDWDNLNQKLVDIFKI